MKKILLFIIAAMVIPACRKAVEKDNLKIGYEKYLMPNGLQVILHTDHSDPVIAYAIMYHAGSSREIPGKTGFAHLFEHLLFSGSENVPTGKFDKVIEAAGGSNNGFTTRDVTTYFEMFPKNALEQILWLESDRMGFFINSVTPRLMAIQQNVVQNEKRQGEDNAPYGFTDYVIDKNLYPATHPYNWEVIGEMNDLKNANIDDVKNYYEKFYGPNNATLVLAGDFNTDSVKLLINKYFGEIRPHGEVAAREPMVPVLDETKKLFHADNFANVPELTLVWPVPQSYAKDTYALEFLAKILADGKKAPLYRVLIKQNQLTSRVSATDNTSELAGEFTITVRANEGKSLKDIEKGISEAFALFEKDGITRKDLERIKATTEKSFYDGLTSVYNKSLRLAFYNTFLNDPGYIGKDLSNMKAVTIDDIKSVYTRYIKNKPHIVTSFVPRGELQMAADNSVAAQVPEENINEATQVEIATGGPEKIIKTPSVINRSEEPIAGPEPEAKVPVIWKEAFPNGLTVYGIENPELPIVNMSILTDGGISQDRTGLPGVASLVADVLPQGTKTKTPEELEEETELLGSTIRMGAGPEEMIMNAEMLSRNFEKSVSLMKEILFEPRWDTTEFRVARSKALNSIIQSAAQPRTVASQVFYRLVYGTDNIFGYSSRGTAESVVKISINDLKDYFDRCFSPSVTKILIVGNITRKQALEALQPFQTEWKPKEVQFNNYPLPASPDKSTIDFVDIPGSRQSVIYAGYPAISRNNPDYVKAEFVNYRLGGAFTSILNQILREEKGFTYGASSYFSQMKSIAPFVAATSVRSDATFESVRIIKEQMEKYRNGISETDLQFTKNCMIRSNALRFETNRDLIGMLTEIAKYGFPDDYIKRDEDVIRTITLDEDKAIINKYIVPDKMYYVVVGDAATQMNKLEKIGFGKPVLMKP